MTTTGNRPKYAEVKDTPDAMGGRSEQRNKDEEGRKGEGVQEKRAKTKTGHAGWSTNHADTT